MVADDTGPDSAGRDFRLWRTRSVGRDHKPFKSSLTAEGECRLPARSPFADIGLQEAPVLVVEGHHFHIRVVLRIPGSMTDRAKLARHLRQPSIVTSASPCRRPRSVRLKPATGIFQATQKAQIISGHFVNISS